MLIKGTHDHITHLPTPWPAWSSASKIHTHTITRLQPVPLSWPTLSIAKETYTTTSHLCPPHGLRPGDVVLLAVQDEVGDLELAAPPLGDEVSEGIPGQVLEHEEGLEVVIDAAAAAADEPHDVGVLQVGEVGLLDVQLPLDLLQSLRWSNEGIAD